MDLDDRISCYRALQTRDTRFDDRLFIGVTSTGIYCRPICPARTARIENCQFYPSAAAAQRQGFRPCLRCRPESAPGGGAWRGSSDTVARALAFFADADLHDEAGLAFVAARLQVSTRQLRRLFQQHLGASPVSVLQTRRILFAKQLIHETRLPMTSVAMAAGFGSVRRFNETFKAMYKRPPGALRRDAGIAAEGEEMELRLRYQPPYDWPGMLATCRAVPGVAVVSGREYRRSVRSGAASGTVRVWHDPARHCLKVGVRLSDVRALPDVIERVQRRFDTAADIHAINAHLALDTVLAPLVAGQPGLRAPGRWDDVEAEVLALLFAHAGAGWPTAAAALVASCGEALPEALGLPGLERTFPDAGRIAGADLSALPIAASGRAALKALAQAALRDGAAFERHDSDAFSCSDPALVQRSHAWRPWRAYAAQHLFHHPVKTSTIQQEEIA